MLFALMRLRI